MLATAPGAPSASMRRSKPPTAQSMSRGVLASQLMSNAMMQAVPGGASYLQGNMIGSTPGSQGLTDRGTSGPAPYMGGPTIAGATGPPAGQMYNPMGYDTSKIAPWLEGVFDIVAKNENPIMAALKNHTASSLNHSLFRGDASQYGLSQPGTDPNSREMYDPFGTGEDSPMYAFRHMMFSPQDRMNLYNQVLNYGHYDPTVQRLMTEFFAVNPRDVNYYWNAGTGQSSGFDMTQPGFAYA